MARADYPEPCSNNGISDAKARLLPAAFELGSRFVSLHPEGQAVVRSPQDVFNLMGTDMGLFD